MKGAWTRIPALHQSACARAGRFAVYSALPPLLSRPLLSCIDAVRVWPLSASLSVPERPARRAKAPTLHVYVMCAGPQPGKASKQHGAAPLQWPPFASEQQTRHNLCQPNMEWDSGTEAEAEAQRHKRACCQLPPSPSPSIPLDGRRSSQLPSQRAAALGCVHHARVPHFKHCIAGHPTQCPLRRWPLRVLRASCSITSHPAARNKGEKQSKGSRDKEGRGKKGRGFAPLAHASSVAAAAPLPTLPPAPLHLTVAILSLPNTPGNALAKHAAQSAPRPVGQSAGGVAPADRV